MAKETKLLSSQLNAETVEMVTEETRPRKALYRNGWLVGFLVTAAISIAFLAFVRDVKDPFIELLLVGLPIGVAIGALAGLAAKGRAIPRDKRNIIGLSVLIGLITYIVVLFFILMSATG